MRLGPFSLLLSLPLSLFLRSKGTRIDLCLLFAVANVAPLLFADFVRISLEHLCRMVIAQIFAIIGLQVLDEKAQYGG